ncbi:MAG TPA: DUF998 domain-containing protein [Acidimicrobiales bacterium]|jgi:hypothetical protein
MCCGAAAGPLFVTIFLIEGMRRSDYKPLRHPVSSLPLGPRGWVQGANFAATGMLYLAGAAGLLRSSESTECRRLGSAVLGATGLGLLGSATFKTDPVSGYPPGTPDVPIQHTTTGKMHDSAALPIFIGIPTGAFACAWRFQRCSHRGWALYSVATGIFMVVATGLFGAGFGQKEGLVGVAGLFQRLAIVTGFGFLSALSVRALRRPEPRRAFPRRA